MNNNDAKGIYNMLKELVEALREIKGDYWYAQMMSKIDSAIWDFDTRDE